MHPLAQPFSFLDHATFPYLALWDWFRVAAALSTTILGLFFSRIAFGAERPEESQGHEVVVTIRIGVISFMFILVPVVLTELAQIGMPLVVWRLPFITLANFFGWWYVRRRL